jgi:hypothetical protein
MRPGQGHEQATLLAGEEDLPRIGRLAAPSPSSALDKRRAPPAPIVGEALLRCPKHGRTEYRSEATAALKPQSRRRFLAIVALTAASFAYGPTAGQERPVPESAPEAAAGSRAPARGPARDRTKVTLDHTTLRAVERGLDYLVRNQNPDGSWTDRVGRKVHMTYRGTKAPHVGVTALAGVSLLSYGTLPGQGPSRRVVVAGGERSFPESLCLALEFTLRSTQENGYISAHGSRMYSHAFAALFLAEAYGTGFYGDTARVKDCLGRATRLIVSAQNEEGGWRYRPGVQDSDMSVTVCQVMALRAARNAGIEVPRETIRRAVKYVHSSYLPHFGAFTYQLGDEFRGFVSRHSFALTAAGVSTLFGAGEYDAYEIREGLKFLWQNQPRRSEARFNFDYYYGQYYAVQAMFQAGGENWRRWYEYIRQELLALQEPSGCWSDLVGSNYATAMATIILQFPNQYLPITEN